ncbi:MAG: hypothetical protein ACM3NT_03715 [Methylocystaceae bacterium]
MADINDSFDIRLRAAAPEFFLQPNFTQRVMMKTVYQPSVKPERQHNHQLRLAGVSMILAGLLIMAAEVMPVNQDIKSIKTTLEMTADQMSVPNLLWLNFKPAQFQTGGEIK